MVDFDDERKSQLDDVLARYAIASLEDANNICFDKGIDVINVLFSIKQDISEIAQSAFVLGTAIAIKKDTKLASYAAIDIGEGIQTFCAPDSDAAQNQAGVGFGAQISKKIRNIVDESTLIDYSGMLDFLGLSGEELTKITMDLAEKIEGKMR